METQLTPDISDYLAAVKRRHFLLLVIALPIIAIAVALAIGLPSEYVSTALVQFSQATISGELPSEQAMRTPAYMDEQRTYADQYVANLRDSVLNARALAPVIAQARGLPTVPSDPDAAEQFIAGHTAIKSVRTAVLDPDTGRNQEIISAFSVSFESRNPHTAHAVAKALTAAVIKASRRTMLVPANEANQFYAAAAKRYHAQIGSLETELADFKTKHFGELPELTNINLGQMDRMQQDLENATLQIQQLTQDRTFLSVQLQQAKDASNTDQTTLTRLEAEYSQKEALYGDNYPDVIALKRQIESLRNGGAQIEGMTLSQQLATEQQTLRSERQRYSDAYPDVQATVRRIKALKQRISRGEKAIVGAVPESSTVVQLKTQIDSVNNEIKGVEAHEANLHKQVNELEKRLQSTPLIERKYQQLTSGLSVARAKYDDLVEHQMNAELTVQAIKDGRSDQLHVVNQPATPERPAKPRRLAIVVIGFILAAVLSLSAVIGAESLDQTVRGSRDVRRVLSLAPLAVIPRIQDALTVRRQRLRIAALGCTVMIGGIVAVLTVSRFM
ncbi:MAG: GumC family protein [Steroidobacteraceae bacterium]